MIKKSDAVENVGRYYESAIQALEKRIDSAIERYYRRKGSVTINVEQEKDFVIQAVTDKYTAAGWNVKSEKGSNIRSQDSWHNLILS